MKLAVVGSGILGKLVALQALQKGWQVDQFHLHPEQEKKATSWAAGGMIAPFAEAAGGDFTVLSRGQESIQLWREILANIARPELLTQKGSLIVAHGRDQALFLDYWDRLHTALGLEDGAPFNRGDSAQMLDGSGVAAIEPILAGRFLKGLFLPQEAHLCPTLVLDAIQKALEGHKRWQAHHAREPGLTTSFLPCPHWVRHQNQQKWGPYNWVIDCRGIGAIDDIPSLRGVRGEAIVIRTTELQTSRPIRLLHPRYSLYLVPRGDHYFYLGATSSESEYGGPICVQSSLELLSACYSLHPAFAGAELVATKVGIRPCLPNHLPEVWSEPGLIRANGLFRHGYLLAPMVARDCLLNIVEDEI